MNVFITFFASILLVGDCANILGVFNHPGSSHTFLGKVLLKNLALRGHNVTMISAFPMETKLTNYHDIALPELLEDMKSRQNKFSSEKPTEAFAEVRNMTLSHTEATFRNPRVQALLKSNTNFDVVIVDFFYNDATWIFGHIYRSPIILMSSFGNNFLLNQLIGNTLPYSYVPGAGLPISDDIPFKYRVLMSISNLLYESIVTQRTHKLHNELLMKYFPNSPPVQKLSENIALVLSNSHFSLETPRPYTPNIIPVGGFHVEQPEPLPKELKKFLDSATDGVIFFSLGSQIKASAFNENTIKAILKVFSGLKQKILLKYDTDDFQFPKNVKILKWAPQIGVLSHPNVKLFITHAGSLSMIESIHFTVPMLCIPFNGDQMTNAEFIETRQLGRKINPKDLNETNFVEIINDLLENRIYKDRVNHYSDLLRNQAVAPLDNAIYWVEHVIKYRGAPHLKPFSLKLPWYKYYMIDVIATGIVVVWIIYKSLALILKKLLAFIKSAKQKID